MAVARKHVNELLEVLTRYLPTQVGELLHELTLTQAYAQTRSLRETIDLLIARLPKGGERGDPV